MISAQDELEKFLNRRATVFSRALQNLADSMSKGYMAWREAFDDLAELIRKTQILANLHGRMMAWQEVDEATGKFTALPDSTPIVPRVTFTEAVEDILTREPRVVPDEIPENQRAEWVSSLYTKDHAFAAARSVEDKLTKKIQKIIETAVREGRTAGQTENEIMQEAANQAHNWSRAYASTVYRTNTARAYTEGRFEQARDEDVKAVTPAFKFSAIRDDVTRHNHAAADGLIASTDDPVWETLKPPLGYNCRCSVRFVSKFELEREGLFQDGRVKKFEPPGFEAAGPDGPPFTTSAQF